MEQDYGNQVEDEIHQMETNSSFMFLTKEEHDNSCHEMGELPAEET